MVKYIYDAWGNFAVEQNANCSKDARELEYLNPYRYRGYYYDREICLYFLQTRYYDPEIGRFVSQDSIDYASYISINGFNLYVYCFNNPLKYVDITGTIPLANYINRITFTKKIWGFKSRWWGRIDYSVSHSETDKDDVGFFYAYSDFNGANLISTWGVGINVCDWWGLDISVDSEFNLNFGTNITPWFHMTSSIGLNGISLSLGLTIKGESHDFTIGLGFGPIALIAGAAAIFGSAGQVLQPVFEFFKKLFSF